MPALKNLLFLVHRIPFPPNKGDKIRSYPILRHLSDRYRVHLGTFVDDENDWQYREHLDDLCASTHVLDLRPAAAKLQSLGALLSGEALSPRYYRSDSMQNWVRETIQRHEIQLILVFSSAMAQFVPADAKALKLIDFVDVDSDKWRQYAATKYWPLSWIYRREARDLLDYDRKVARAFDHCFFVSEAEAALFRQLAPESREKVHFFPNGVDSSYFAPEKPYPNPYPSRASVLVFTGAMDYWPNIDAVLFFARKVFPGIRAKFPKAWFFVVGSNPAAAVKALGKCPGIVVTGRVGDIRPFLVHARLALAPLRIGRGIQNKVLEALAMNKPVLASRKALEGLPPYPGKGLLVAESAPEMKALALKALASDWSLAQHIRNSHWIQKHFSWPANLTILDQFLEPELQPRLSFEPAAGS